MAPELLRALHNKRLTPRLCCVYRIVLGRFFKFRWASLLGAKTARCTFEQNSYTQRGRASKFFPLYFHFRRNINQETGESFPGFLFFFLSFSNSLFVVPKFLERDSISKRRVVCGPRQPAKLGKVCSLLLCSLWSFWRVCVCVIENVRKVFLQEWERMCRKLWLRLRFLFFFCYVLPWARVVPTKAYNFRKQSARTLE